MRLSDTLTSAEARTVLVVDDDRGWIAALAAWLQREGYHVLSLSPGDRVMDALDNHRVDAIILDVELGGVDGLEILDQVHRGWPSLPVIITSAFGGSETGAVARRHGAAGYLEKPFRMADLVIHLRTILSSRDGGSRR
jgi:DNA-binding NtrC family response regulator